eukprot:12267162-Heterocapsa_arctica.AAC.1
MRAAQLAEVKASVARARAEAAIANVFALEAAAEAAAARLEAEALSDEDFHDEYTENQNFT